MTVDAGVKMQTFEYRWGEKMLTFAYIGDRNAGKKMPTFEYR